MIPASRLKRFIAYIIDGLIVSIPITLLMFVIPLGFPIETGAWTTFVIKYNSLIYLLITLFYFALFESSKYKATPGKMIFNLYVSDTNNQKLNFFRAVGRYILWVLPTFPLLFIQISSQSESDYELKMGDWWWLIIIMLVAIIIWVITVFFTKEKTTIYDMLSYTRVNAQPKSPEESQLIDPISQ